MDGEWLKCEQYVQFFLLLGGDLYAENAIGDDGQPGAVTHEEIELSLLLILVKLYKLSLAFLYFLKNYW